MLTGAISTEFSCGLAQENSPPLECTCNTTDDTQSRPPMHPSGIIPRVLHFSLKAAFSCLHRIA
jgi:hypothetical protein